MSVSFADDWSNGLRKGGQDDAAAEGKTTTGGGTQSGRPVEVYRAFNDLEAQVIKSLLEAHGIPVWLRGEALGPTLAVAVGGLAEVSVMVPEALAPRAQELLETEAEAAEGEEFDEDPDENQP